jgi:hypothetical protein
LIVAIVLLGAYWSLKLYQVRHVPVLAEARSLEVPDLSAPVIALPFCDISAALLQTVHSTGQEAVRASTLDFIDGSSVWIKSALGPGISAAPYVFQQEYKDRFLSYDRINAYYAPILSGLYSTPWRQGSLTPEERRLRKLTPFFAQAGTGLVVESEPDVATAFLWDSDRTRLAVLTSSRGGASHLWEILESWRWRERPDFRLDPSP